jgi:hypothetical protein
MTLKEVFYTQFIGYPKGVYIGYTHCGGCLSWMYFCDTSTPPRSPKSPERFYMMMRFPLQQSATDHEGCAG